jgi:hypothetical protein
VTSDQPDGDSDQPDVLGVVHVVVADLHGRDAYGYTDENGEPIICADAAIVNNDPKARESAFKLFVAALA